MKCYPNLLDLNMM